MTKHGLVKILKDGDDEIKLVGNALTFVLYKSYFGRDLLNDIVGFAKKNANAEVMEKLLSLGDLDKLEDDKALQLLDSMADYSFDSEFILQFIAALMATAQYPNKPEVGELIMQIPPHFIVDRDVVQEVVEFLSLFIRQKATRGVASESLGK